VKESNTGSLDHVPPASELFDLGSLAERHPGLLPENRLRWMARHRETNGLAEAGAVYKSRVGELLFHEPATISWLLNLSGRAKPRRVRKQSTTR
jgi:hypothetical protein